MHSSLDSFAAAFDSISIEPARARDDDAPGFCLLDDANGRFVVDPEIGVVSLADEALLESERGAVHGVKLRVVEPSGLSYEMDLRLRLTGRVPQMVGGEEYAAALAAAPPGAPERPAPRAASAVIWTRYAPALAVTEKTRREHGRRAFITAEIPAAGETLDRASLDFDGELGVFSASASWSL
jgi:hypothetical protein